MIIIAIQIDNEAYGEISLVKTYGNLKTLCDDFNVSYHTYKVKKFPFNIGSYRIFKTELKRGGRKNNKITHTGLD